MASPAEKLAQSLAALQQQQDRGVNDGLKARVFAGY
jgi:hypothetical protein